jgi:hypothetical protein
MRMIFGAIGGMKFGRGNRNTRRKPTSAPLCPPQNPTWQTRFRTPDRSGEKPATNRLSYGAAFPFHVSGNLYSPLTCSFKSLWSRMWFVVEVITVGGGLLCFLGASCSGSAFCASVIPVSLSIVLRGAKNLRVNTAFGSSLTAADVWTDWLV